MGAPHSESFKCFYVKLLGGPQGLSGAQVRPALDGQRLTDGIHEAPDFSGSDGALTLLSFFFLGYFLFPEDKKQKRTIKPQYPHPQGSSGGGLASCPRVPALRGFMACSELEDPKGSPASATFFQVPQRKMQSWLSCPFPPLTESELTELKSSAQV